MTVRELVVPQLAGGRDQRLGPRDLEGPRPPDRLAHQRDRGLVVDVEALAGGNARA
jgi:hypothetical protein